MSAECILNEQFKLNILNEVMMLTANVADTSELFLRSWQLIEPFTECHIKADEVTLDSNEDLIVPRDIDREKMLATALYLSRFEHHHLNIGNQTETFKYYARRLGIPYGTLRNYRDSFDRYVENNRRGWNKALPPELKVSLEFNKL